MYTYQAIILRVIDADTFEVFLDLGLYTWKTVRVRLLGVQAPERYTEDGKAATEWVKQWLHGHDRVVIETKKKDSFGRWLAVLKVGDRELNQDMLDEGIAVPYKKS